MPGITAIRIAGLKVGRYRDKLHDCTFKTTLGEGSNGNLLVNLVNGGGKSTMILALEQIFKPGTVRSRQASEQNAINNIADLLNKDGDHYFALVEFALDDGMDVSPEENRLVAGIAMRHKPGAQAKGSTKERVDYYTFISVYGEGSGAKNSIENLPLTEYNEAGKSRLAPYDALMSWAKSDSFELYSGNPQATKRYLDALEAYGVPARTLAKAYALVGTTENGIGDWANKEITTVEKLMEYLIGVVVQKGNLGTSDLSETLMSYAELYEAKKDDERTRTAAQDAEPLLDNLIEASDRMVGAHAAVDDAAHDIDAFIGACEAQRVELESKCEANERELANTDKELSELAFHGKSFAYFKAHNNAQALFTESEAKELDWKRTQGALSEARHRERVLKCARVESKIRESDREIARIEGSIARQESKSRVSEELADLKFATKRAAERERDVVQTQLRELDEAVAETKRDLGDATAAWRTTSTSLKAASTEQARLEGSISTQRSELERCFEIAGVPFSMSLDGLASTAALKKKRVEAESWLARLSADAEELSVARDNVQASLAETRIALGAATSNVEATKGAYLAARDTHAAYLKSLEECFVACDKASVDARTNGLVWASNDVDDKNARRRDEMRTLENEIHESYRVLAAIRSKTLHLSADAREWFDSRGIGYTTGEARFSSCSDEVKSGILKNHPEMLYGVVLDESQYAAFERAEKEGWQQSLVPVYRQSEVVSLSQEGACSSDYLALPNKEALSNPDGFEQAVRTRLKSAEERKSAIEAHLTKLQKARDAIKRHASVYNDEDGQSEERFSQACDEARKEYNASKERRDELCASVTALENETAALEAKLKSNERSAEEQNRLLESVEEAADKADEHNTLVRNLEEAIRKVSDLTSSFEKLDARKHALEKKIDADEEAVRAAKGLCEAVDSTLDEVKDAPYRDTDIDGKSEVLFQRYISMRDAESAKMRDLKQALQDAKAIRSARLETQDECAGDDALALSEGKSAFENASEKRIEQELDNVACSVRMLAKDEEVKRAMATDAIGDAKQAQGKVSALHDQIVEEYGKEPFAPLDFTEENAEERKRQLNKRKDGLASENERAQKRIKETSRAETDATKKKNELFGNIKIMPSSEQRSLQLEDNVYAQKDQFEIKAEKALDNLESEERSLRRVFERYEKSVFAQQCASDAVTRLKECLQSVKSTAQAESLKRTFEDNSKAVARLIEALNVNLAKLDSDFDELVAGVQVRQALIYDELKQIENHSRIRFEGDSAAKATLQLNLPEREAAVEGEGARKRVKDFLEDVAHNIASEKSQTCREKIAKACMKASSIFSVVVPLGSLKVKKLQGNIDRDRRQMIAWSGGLSGAENMLAASIVLTASMNYLMSNDVSTAKRPRTVLILDNPYGAATSESLLNPFYSLCEQTKTQIIAFSDLATLEITSGITTRYTLTRKDDTNKKGHIVMEGGPSAGKAAGGELESASYHIKYAQDALL